jgi:hypothetical protein
MTDIRSQILDEFSGFDDGAIFELDNGQVWQQRHYQYRYHYAYRPAVRVYSDGGRYMMDVAGMNEAVEVIQVSVLVEGPIISDFNGFDGSSKFQFQNGQVWQQAEYKYNYHYAYRPRGIIIDGINGAELRVEGMSETVKVRRLK